MMKSTNPYLGIGSIAVVAAFVIAMTFGGTVIYVAWHFIEKLW